MTRPIYLQTAIVAFFATALLASSASAATVRNFSVLKSFGSNAFSEAFLSAPLTEGTDGYLYGTAQTGGAGGQGVIFRITKSGSEYSVLHAFTGSDGGAPRGGLIEPVSGQLFGTASTGGTNGTGVIFRIHVDGSDYSVLHHFGGFDGAVPICKLVRATDGLLYGTASAGGSNNVGTIFRISSAGTGFQIVFQFGISANDPHTPLAGLIQGSDGFLYGTGSAGGLESVGAIFKMDTSGAGYGILHTFSATDGDGQSPTAALVEGSDGFLYGTTPAGGLWGFGSVFKLPKSPPGYSIIHDFGPTDAQAPLAGLIAAQDGFLYGTSFGGGGRFSGAIFKLSRDGSAYFILRAFGGSADARNPAAPLLLASDGDLYGTTSSGGTLSGNATDGGAIFKLSTAGIGYTILHSFSRTGGDGQSPGGLIMGMDGFLYGTTHSGGAFGNGSIFRVFPDALEYELLYSFKATNPIAEAEQLLPSALLQGTDGLLYGTTHFGGSAGVGVLFKINTDGTGFSVLRNFSRSTSDGRNPADRLIEGSDGMLYGVTQFGGSSDAGIIFKINKNGSGFVLLRSFSRNGTEAYYPYATLTRARNGKLYGSASAGGEAAGGILFEINQDGTGYTPLHNFGPGDAMTPASVLLEGSNGLLYGSTQQGGNKGAGNVFSLAKGGSSYSTLWSFSADDGLPSELIQGADGLLYGMTSQGGRNGGGTVFQITTNGSSFRVVHGFDAGRNPQGGLVMDSEGSLYGSTGNGGGLGLGTVFKLTSEPGVELRAALSHNFLEITWPYTPITYRLEAADNVNGTWESVNIAPFVLDGQSLVVVAPSGHARFYRLAR